MNPDAFRCSSCEKPVPSTGLCFSCDADPVGAPSAPRCSAVLLVPAGYAVGAWAAIRGIKHGGKVEVPGGKVEPGETPAEAAMREAREELGVDLDGVPICLGEFEHEHDGVRWCCTAFVLSRLWFGDLVGSPEGPALWATREELVAGAHGEVIRRVFDALDAHASALAALGFSLE